MVGHLITLKGGSAMPKLVKVAETKEVAPGTGKVVGAEGRSIALFNVAGTFYAIDNNCTHEGGPLGEGALVGEVVTCPWHNTEFNVRTGAALGPLPLVHSPTKGCGAFR
jgi:nitrite reductase/ring-hydroxylating ferredoxin subunit